MWYLESDVSRIYLLRPAAVLASIIHALIVGAAGLLLFFVLIYCSVLAIKVSDADERVVEDTMLTQS